MSNSLEDERRAILERMSASRESYRNMFAHEDKHENEHEMSMSARMRLSHFPVAIPSSL